MAIHPMPLEGKPPIVILFGNLLFMGFCLYVMVKSLQRLRLLNAKERKRKQARELLKHYDYMLSRGHRLPSLMKKAETLLDEIK